MDRDTRNYILEKEEAAVDEAVKERLAFEKDKDNREEVLDNGGFAPADDDFGYMPTEFDKFIAAKAAEYELDERQTATFRDELYSNLFEAGFSEEEFPLDDPEVQDCFERAMSAARDMTQGR